MKSNSRNAVGWMILLALPVVAGVLLAGEFRQLHGSGLVPENQRARRFVRFIPAQANPADAKAAPAKTPEERTPEQKKRVKSAVILLSVLSGIALSGLLLIIAAVSIRGLQRKLAGPTRLDREPTDLFPPRPRPEPDLPPAVESATPADSSSQETRLT